MERCAIHRANVWKLYVSYMRTNQLKNINKTKTIQKKWLNVNLVKKSNNNRNDLNTEEPWEKIIEYYYNNTQYHLFLCDSWLFGDHPSLTSTW